MSTEAVASGQRSWGRRGRSASYDVGRATAEATEFAVPSEPPPSYQDVITGKSPSIKVRSQHAPYPAREQVPSPGGGAAQSSPHSPPAAFPSVRRTQSAARPDNEHGAGGPHAPITRSQSLTSPPQLPWQPSAQSHPSPRPSYATPLEPVIESSPAPHHPVLPEQAPPTQQSDKGRRCFLISSLVICPFWFVVCIALAVIAALNTTCPSSLYLGIESASFFAFGAVSCTISVAIAICVRVGESGAACKGFVCWWVVWLVVIATFGILVYFGWDPIFSPTFRPLERPDGCDLLVIYSAFGGLVLGLVLCCLLAVLMLLLCCVCLVSIARAKR